jgi:hypothetical protein
MQPNQKLRGQQELNAQIYENNLRAAQLASQLNKQKTNSQSSSKPLGKSQKTVKNVKSVTGNQSSDSKRKSQN